MKSKSSELRIHVIAALSSIFLIGSWICVVDLFGTLYATYWELQINDNYLEVMTDEFERWIREFRRHHNLHYDLKRFRRSLRNNTKEPRDFVARDYATASVEEINQCTKCLAYTNSCPRGPPGPVGPPGHQGENGLDGIDGHDGAPGISLVYDQAEPGCIVCQKGPPGLPGPIGHVGSIGAIGNPGEPGLPGDSAPDGVRGPFGETGPPGIKGAPGRAGLPGLDGTRGKGQSGQQGPPGPTGLPGTPGSSGIPARIGPSGSEGVEGQPGIDGLDGLEGPVGDIGPRGEPGPDGQYCPCPHRVPPPVRPFDSYRSPSAGAERPRGRPPGESPYDNGVPYDERPTDGEQYRTYANNNKRPTTTSRPTYGSENSNDAYGAQSSGGYNRSSFRRALISRLEKKFGSSF